MVSTQATGDPAGRFGLAGGSGSIETDSMSSPVAICGFSGLWHDANGCNRWRRTGHVEHARNPRAGTAVVSPFSKSGRSDTEGFSESDDEILLNLNYERPPSVGMATR